MVFVQSVVSEVDNLFPLVWRHLLWRYPGSYVTPLPSAYTIAPPGPDYSYNYPIGRAPEHRDIDPYRGGGYGVSYNLGYPTKLGLMNNPLSISIANLGTDNLVRMNNPIPSEARVTNLLPYLADVPLNSPPDE